MSTRAVIGVVQYDGSFLGAWQWCDAGYIIDKLNKKFIDDKSVKELLSVGMWKAMYGAREFKKYFPISKIDGNVAYTDNHDFTSKAFIVNNVFLTIERGARYDTSPRVYKNVEEAFGQDINYIYIYFPQLHRWKKYGNLRALYNDGLVSRPQW
ncbi:MAG: hypothetical protein IJE45_04735 [Bacilli bacterium]|nr:hypothetical protein [Bacilli bacterium]